MTLTELVLKLDALENEKFKLEMIDCQTFKQQRRVWEIILEIDAVQKAIDAAA